MNVNNKLISLIVEYALRPTIPDLDHPADIQ